ncbi:MAG TPA: AAA family ATPase, partial [Limnochordia bacterium]|nr:AAA family ATPase [Limnochordia bacterium]
METLQETLAEARARRFVGRRAELARVEAWFARDGAPTRLFAVSGMGGIGKSALLQQILRLAQARGADAVWQDGSACTPTPTGFLDYLRMLRPDEGPSGPAGGRVVWCIDNYDHLTVIESWLRDAILARLPDTGALLVLASRQPLSLGWRVDLGWRERIVSFRLSPFTQEEIREYTRRIGGDLDAQPQTLIRETGGLPLAVTLAVAADVRGPARARGSDAHTG